jgi:hypothetical protein
MPGIENRMELLYSEGVLKERISLNKFVELTSTAQAKNLSSLMSRPTTWDSCLPAVTSLLSISLSIKSARSATVILVRLTIRSRFITFPTSSSMAGEVTRIIFFFLNALRICDDGESLIANKPLIKILVSTITRRSFFMQICSWLVLP